MAIVLYKLQNNSYFFLFENINIPENHIFNQSFLLDIHKKNIYSKNLALLDIPKTILESESNAGIWIIEVKCKNKSTRYFLSRLIRLIDKNLEKKLNMRILDDEKNVKDFLIQDDFNIDFHGIFFDYLEKNNVKYLNLNGIAS